jgi:hypothetical protein
MLHSVLFRGLRTSLKALSGHTFDAIQDFNTLRIALRQIEKDHELQLFTFSSPLCRALQKSPYKSTFFSTSPYIHYLWYASRRSQVHNYSTSFSFHGSSHCIIDAIWFIKFVDLYNLISKIKYMYNYLSIKCKYKNTSIANDKPTI